MNFKNIYIPLNNKQQAAIVNQQRKDADSMKSANSLKNFKNALANYLIAESLLSRPN